MKSEKGFSLIEVAIAIVLLGIVAIAVLGALATSSRALFIADERAAAESLARTEMEYVRNQEYSGAPWTYELPLPPGWPSDSLPSWWDEDNPHTLPEGYDGYTINVSAVPIHEIGGHPIDDGIHKITVKVYHPYDAEDPEDYVVKLENYRSVR